MTEPSHAVFLSYASQDTEAAKRMCGVLRAAGIEVWFDQSELRGGDAWDQSIRKQIKTCALFVPVISKHTHERCEGYFRLEWKLAVDRCHLMAADKAFLVPVVIDDTPDDDERVPEKFRELQWTRLPEGNTRPEFVTRIQQLLSGSPTLTRSAAPVSAGRPPRLTSGWLAVAILLAALAAYLLAEKPWTSKPAPHSKPAASTDPPVAFNPPPHSIAVLPFTNMSGDVSQGYFADGLAEEIINTLSHIDSLRVTGRTSSFSMRGQGLDIGAIARRLNVGSILEGSVRRSGTKVRVTTQLLDVKTGFQIWSQAYDQGISDVFRIQTEIARSVANHLDVELTGLAIARLGVGGTQNVEALDAYLRATHIYESAVAADDFRRAAAGYDTAIARDPRFAAAHAMRANAIAVESVRSTNTRERAEFSRQAMLSAERAVSLAPDFAEAYATRGFVRTVALLDFGDSEDFARAARLAPGSAFVQARLGVYSDFIGRSDVAIAADRRAIELDPEFMVTRNNYADALIAARRYDEALAAIEEAKKRSVKHPDEWLEDTAVIYLAMGRADQARELCAKTVGGPEPFYGCLAMAYHALGQATASDEAYRQFLERDGVTRIYERAAICAQLGRTAEALSSLRGAVDVRDPDLQHLRTDWRLDGLRNTPEYKAIERELHFPP